MVREKNRLRGGQYGDFAKSLHEQTACAAGGNVGPLEMLYAKCLGEVG